MKLINEFETNSTFISIYLLDGVEVNKEPIYVIISVEKKSGKKYTRYGNEVQMKSIIKTYRKYDGSRFTL